MSRAARYTAIGLALFGLLGSSLIATAPAYGDHYRSHSYREVDGADCLDHRHDRECKSRTRLDADDWDVGGRSDLKVVELFADVDFFQKRYVRHRYDDHKRYDDDRRWKHRHDWRKKRDWKDRDDWRKKCDWKDRDDRKRCDWKDRDDWKKRDWKDKRDWQKREDGKREDGKRKDGWTKDEEKRPDDNSSETEKKSTDNENVTQPPAGTTPPDSTNRNPDPGPDENANQAATDNPGATEGQVTTPQPDPQQPTENANQSGSTEDQVTTPQPTPQPNDNASQSATTENPAATGSSGTQTDSTGGVANENATTNQSTNANESADAKASASADTTSKPSSCEAAAAKSDPNSNAADVCSLATARGSSVAFHGKRFHRHYHDDLGTVLFQVWDDDDDRWRTFFSEDVDDDGEADVKFKVRIRRHHDLLFRAVYLGVDDEIRGSISRVVEIY